jgi:hypothetical protein
MNDYWLGNREKIDIKVVLDEFAVYNQNEGKQHR